MHYIIDGYNLLFRILTKGESLASQRQHIIESLNRKIQVIGIDVSIVFDSNYNITDTPKSHYKHLAIQFTSKGMTADEWIIDHLKRSTHPEHTIVVTSDKRLAVSIRQCSGKVDSVEDFVTNLNKRYKNKLESLKAVPEKKVTTTLITPLIPLPASEKAKTADSKKHELKPEQCFEFYLKQFEDNFNKMAKPAKPLKIAKRVKKHEFPKEVKPEVKYRSDFERWHAAFEE